MKKKKTNLAKSARKFPRRPLIIVTTIAVLGIAAITVVSRQLVSGKQTSEKTTAAANAADKKFTKVKFAGQELPLDAKGQIRPLTPDEARQMADRLKGMLNRSTKGLVQEHKADGSTSMDLQDRFQHVTIARVNADGTVTTACVDNPQAAGAFLGIDPKLLQPDQQ